MVSSVKFSPKIVIALIGVILSAFILRAAVSVFSPLAPTISQDLPFDSLSLGVMGMIPTAAFAIFGFFTPFVLRWASFELLTVIAMICAAIGQIGRLFMPNIPLFMVFSLIGFAGLGAGNVLLPPLVKRYFPRRVGLVTTIYVTVLSVGTALPSQLAVPLARSYSWQMSMGTWGVISLIAAIPWMILLLGHSRANRMAITEAERGESALIEPEQPPKPSAAKQKLSMWRSSMALGLTAMVGLTSLNTYSMFAWLPSILVEAGYSPSTAGSLLALFGALGIPLGLTVPLIASKMRNQFPMVVVFLSLFVSGYIGLMLWPNPLGPLWACLIGLGPGTFTLSLLLINLRTRTHEGAGALSGFSQGVGYAVACLGPLLFGIGHQLTGSWYLSFGFLFAALIGLGTGAYFACKPVFLEDQQAKA